MKRINEFPIIKIQYLIFVIFWSAFSFAVAMFTIGLKISCDFSFSFLRQAYFAWIYGDMAGRTIRLGMGAAISFFVAFSVKVFLADPKKFHPPVLFTSIFFALNTMIHINPGRILNCLLIPHLSVGINLILWLTFLVNFYFAALDICFLMRKPLSEPTKSVSSRKAQLLFAVVILAGWLPMLITLAPGVTYYDTAKQILEFQGLDQMEASNPIALTLVYGSLFSIGQALGGNNVGLLVCVLFQTALLLYALSEGCKDILVYTGSRLTAVFAALFFASMPCYPSFAVIVLKDCVYGAFFLLFALSYVHVLREGKRGDLIRTLIFSALCALTRKSSVYISIASLIVLGLYKKGMRRSLLTGAIALFAGNILLNNVVYPAFGVGVSQTMKREKYSFVFQQTGYYCMQHRDELTQEDIRIIDAVLDFDAVCNDFSLNISDPVKSTYHAESSQSMREYLMLNVRFFFRHPITCLESLIYTKNYYFDPFHRGQMSLYRSGGIEFSNWMNEDWVDQFQDFRTTAGKKLPILILTSSGTYSWVTILLLLAGWEMKKSKKMMEVFPLTAAMIGYLLTHTNGDIRYSSPLIMAAPIILLLFREKNASETHK